MQKLSDIAMNFTVSVFSLLIFIIIIEVISSLLGYMPMLMDRRYSNSSGYFLYTLYSPNCNSVNISGDGKSVMILGGSTMAGDYEIGKSDVLPSLLSKSFKVYDYSKPGKDSFYFRQCASNLASVRPDYLVIYPDNDYISTNVKHPNPVLYMKQHAWARDAMVFIYEHSGTYTMMNDIIESIKKKSKFHDTVTSGDLEQKKSLIADSFEDNLISVIDAAEKSGTRVVIFTVASNLDDQPPFESMASPNATAIYLEAKRLYAEGDHAKARSLFLEAKEADPTGRRTYEVINQRIWKISKSYPVTVIDFESALLSSQSVGCNYFGGNSSCDFIHPNKRGHEIMYELVMPVLTGS